MSLASRSRHSPPVGAELGQEPGPGSLARSRTERLGVSGIVALALTLSGFMIFRVGDLGLGLQTDELLSAWITNDTLGDAIWRAQRFQGNSCVYFVFLWFWRQLVAQNEVLLRLPSLIAVGAAMYQTVRFGRDLGSQTMGAVAACVLLGGASVSTAALTARPYGFLLLFAVVSTRALWVWLNSGRVRAGLLWILALVLAVAMTPFAAPLGVVHAIAIAESRRRTGVFAPRLVSLVGLGAVLALPIVPQIVALSDRRASLVIIAPPRPIAIAIVALPWLSVIVVAILRFVWPERRRDIHDIESPEIHPDGLRAKTGQLRPRTLLFACWALVPPVLLFVAGLVGDSPVFSARYRSVALFGGAFLVGQLVISTRRPARLAAAVLVAFISVSSVAGAAPERHGWRDAIRWADTTTASHVDRVVALNPGLIESEDYNNLDDPEWVDYLGSALATYRLDAPIVLLAEHGPMAGLAEPRLDRLFAHDTIIVIDGPPGHRWRELVRAQARARGFAEAAESEHESLSVSVFTRQLVAG